MLGRVSECVANGSLRVGGTGQEEAEATTATAFAKERARPRIFPPKFTYNCRILWLQPTLPSPHPAPPLPHAMHAIQARDCVHFQISLKVFGHDDATLVVFPAKTCREGLCTVLLSESSSYISLSGHCLVRGMSVDSLTGRRVNLNACVQCRLLFKLTDSPSVKSFPNCGTIQRDIWTKWVFPKDVGCQRRLATKKMSMWRTMTGTRWVTNCKQILV